jgi:tetratricopeptide (TPR) repeat protein
MGHYSLNKHTMSIMSAQAVETKSFGLDRVAFIIFQVVLFLSPIFFVPSINLPFQTSRASFILYGIVAAFLVWAVARLKDGIFEVPRSLFYASAGIVGIAYVVSALMSANQPMSLAGTGLEIGTLAFFLPSFILFLLVPLIVKTQEQIFYSYATILASFFVVALFHVIRFMFGADALSFGMFTTATANFIGKWNDLGIFFGLCALVSFVTLEKVNLTKLVKVLVYLCYALSLFMLVVVNFTPVWITLAVLSLVFFVYKFSFDKEEGTIGSRIPYHALIVLILSVLFLFAGGKLSALIADSLGTSQLEVRPSWAATFEIAKQTLSENPIFGVGPNRFSADWLMHKPTGINNTLFWNVDFNYGIAFIPSFLTTTGLVGLIAILLFVALFVKLAIQALLRSGASPFSRYLVLSSLFGSLYLWTFSFVYVPSASIWILTIILTGLFVASAREDKILATRGMTIMNRPAASFISVLLIILAIIGSIAFAYFVTVKLIASTYFQKGVITINTKGDLDSGERDIVRAINLSPSDAYFQSLSELYLVRINNLFQNQKITQSEAQAQFQNLMAAAIRASQAAVAYDATNYRNHLSLGRVFEAVVPLKIEGSYDSAKKAYQEALKVNPESPEIYLILARLEVANNNTAAAKEYITQAITKKNDYADAIFLLAQIQIAENDVANAINSVSAVATLSPNDPGIFFQLGLLYYNQKNYQNAVLAFERAITLNPQYANAKYFLGLGYYQLGDKAKALAQFKDILITNPDNGDIKAIIANLEAGKEPFAAPATAANAVKQSSLPVKETTTKEEI